MEKGASRNGRNEGLGGYSCSCTCLDAYVHTFMFMFLQFHLPLSLSLFPVAPSQFSAIFRDFLVEQLGADVTVLDQEEFGACIAPCICSQCGASSYIEQSGTLRTLRTLSVFLVRRRRRRRSQQG